MTYRVKPNPDRKVGKKPLQVRDPQSGEFIPRDGKSVPRNPYWQRRLRDGDVVLCDAPAAKPAKGAKPAKDQKPGPEGDGGGDGPMSLEDAIKRCLEAGDEAHMNSDGTPDCGVLSELTGGQVTRAARDGVLAKLKMEAE